MKIYISIDPDSQDVLYPWKQCVYEQVEETVSAMSPLAENDVVPPFPSFSQDDTHSHYVTTVDNHRYFFEMLFYKLFFVYEPEDFAVVMNEEEWKGSKDTYHPTYQEYVKLAYAVGEKEYNKMCARVGMDKECAVKPSREYVYIGSYRANQTEPMSLPGLVFDTDWPDAASPLDDCMYPPRNDEENK